MVRTQANDVLFAAQRHWFDAAECVEVPVSPQTQESATGGSVALHATARSRADGSELPAARISAFAMLGAPVTFSPSSATGVLDVTASDPGGEWLPKRSPIMVLVESLSRRGRGEGRAQITIPGRPAVPLMHVHATLKTEVPCDDARTTYATVDDATIDGDLTARSSSDERNSTGTGRATGVSRIVMGDCGHVESYPQDDATDFTAAYLSDGTLSVSWVVDGMFMRWSYLGWTAPGNGTRTEDWTDDDGTRHHLTVTISSLRASTD